LDFFDQSSLRCTVDEWAANNPAMELAMWTNRLLKLSVLSGIAAIADSSFSIRAADPAISPPSSAAAPQKPMVATATRPLTAADVWGNDYALARQRAKKLNRPVLLHFHATWCGPCRQMERDVLNSAKVLHELNACCVAVKVDCDQQPALTQQFGVEGLPCDILVTTDGKMQRINLGLVSAEEYTSLISSSGNVRRASSIHVSKN
jgi:thiol:disulfide interchange protein